MYVKFMRFLALNSLTGLGRKFHSKFLIIQFFLFPGHFISLGSTYNKMSTLQIYI